MENMKIYIDGKYSLKENFKLQAKIRGPKLLQKLDDAWCKLYEL